MGNKSSSNKLPPQAQPGTRGEFVSPQEFHDPNRDVLTKQYQDAGLSEILNNSFQQEAPPTYSNAARWDTSEPGPTPQQAGNIALDQAMGGGRFFSKNDPVFQPATPQQLALPQRGTSEYQDILANDVEQKQYRDRQANRPDAISNVLSDEYYGAGLADILQGRFK